MSELINVNDTRATIRWKLLASASALALMAYVSAANTASAEDADRPLIWLELGGDMDSISGQGGVFAPPFLAENPDSSVLWHGISPLQAQQPAKFGFGEDGKISFQPENSDWVFSAAIRYGRSSNSRKVHHQTYDNRAFKYGSGVTESKPYISQHRFSDTQSHREESHAILDFSAGKDVGLGMFGGGASSTINFGVRFAQFTSKSSVEMRALPDMQYKYAPLTYYHITFKLPYFHTYHMTGHASRSFRGVGPVLSWNGSAPFAGTQQSGELTIDWAVNAALLFGKQKALVHHSERAEYASRYSLLFGHGYSGTSYVHPSGGHKTDRSVTVPNLGGSLGVSWRVENFKASLGYRADFFFGAMDTGIDATQKSTIAFKGPYASISIGIP